MKKKKDTATEALKLLKELADASEALPGETDMEPVEFEQRWGTYHAVMGRCRRFLKRKTK